MRNRERIDLEVANLVAHQANRAQVSGRRLHHRRVNIPAIDPIAARLVRENARAFKT